MLKVYEFNGFPNPARVRLALAEKHALDKVTFVTVNVPAGEHRLPAFLAKNPSATVPALELEDGTVISECTAITEYLDHSFPGPCLTGETAKERAVVHMMQRRAESRLLDAVAAYFHHATPGLGPQIELYQNAEWGQHQKQVAFEGMRYFDSVLAASPFVAGETFTMADITVYAALGFAAFLELELPAGCSNLVAWRDRIAARPSVKA
jgi:glutathione S-transferase